MMFRRGERRWLAAVVTFVALLLALPSGALGQAQAAGSWPSNNDVPTLLCYSSKTKNCSALISLEYGEGGFTYRNAAGGAP